MSLPLRSQAVVATETPARYAKQLVSHLGRRLEFATDGDTSRAEIGDGVGTIVVGVHDLTLVAEATDTDGLTRIQDVLGGHLERFGQRNELIVAWSAPVDPAAG